MSVLTTLIAVLGTLAAVFVTNRAGEKTEKRKVVRDKLEEACILATQVKLWATYQHRMLSNMYEYPPDFQPPQETKPSCPIGRLEMLIRLYIPSIRKVAVELSETVTELRFVPATILKPYDDDDYQGDTDEILYNNSEFGNLLKKRFEEFGEAYSKLLSSIEKIAEKM